MGERKIFHPEFPFPITCAIILFHWRLIYLQISRHWKNYSPSIKRYERSINERMSP